MEPASLICRCEWSVFTCYSRKRLQESGSYWQKLKYNFSCGSLKRGKGEDTNWDTHLFGREFIQALAKIIPNRLRWFGWQVLEFSMGLKESKILLSSWKAIDSRFQSFRSDVVCKLEIEKAGPPSWIEVEKGLLWAVARIEFQYLLLEFSFGEWSSCRLWLLLLFSRFSVVWDKEICSSLIYSSWSRLLYSGW